MSAKRALIVAYYFPPLGGGGVARTLKLVRALSDAGWHSLVLTVDDAHWAHDARLLDAVPAGTRVCRLPNPDWGRVAARAGASPMPGRGAGRLARWLVPDLHVGWSALAAGAAAAVALSGALDVVYTSGPPYSAHGVGRVARALGMPWVADFRDAWSDNPARQALPAWRRRVERGLEDAVLRRADRVVFASEAFRTRALARAPALAQKSETIPSGFDARELAGDAMPPADRFELVHAGSVALDRKDDGFVALLDALACWSARDPAVAGSVRVRFLGAEPGTQARIVRAGLQAFVAAEPACARAELGARLRAAHACLYLAPAGPYGGDPLPGKLFDAVGAERPLLALAPDGALAQLVRRLGVGEVIAPGAREPLIAWLARARRRALRGEPVVPALAHGRGALDAAVTMPRLVAALEAAAHGRGAREEGPCRSASLS